MRFPSPSLLCLRCFVAKARGVASVVPLPGLPFQSTSVPIAPRTGVFDLATLSPSVLKRCLGISLQKSCRMYCSTCVRKCQEVGDAKRRNCRTTNTYDTPWNPKIDPGGIENEAQPAEEWGQKYQGRSRKVEKSSTAAGRIRGTGEGKKSTSRRGWGPAPVLLIRFLCGQRGWEPGKQNGIVC